MKRVSKKQKRVRAKSNGTREKSQKSQSAAAKKKLRAKALHLWLGKEHEIDRAAAEKLRKFPHVPRKKQSPFPNDVELGFTGHFHKDGFVMQDKEAFEAEFVTNAENAWYWREDKRGNREPRRQDSGMLETNAALSAGYAMVLADLVRLGELTYVRKVALMAGEAGMRLLCERTGYLPGYLALHPDWEGTLSIHSGLWCPATIINPLDDN